MKPDQENFDHLLRLLKLKRYEQPPPRYFNDFSSRVIERIRAGGADAPEGMFENLFMEAPWLQRLFSVFEAKPAVAWMFGLAVCALVVSGIVYSEAVDYSQTGTMPAASILPVTFTTAQAQEESITAPPMTLSQPINENLVAFSTDGKDTNSIIPQPASLFDLFRPQEPMLPAGFGPGGE